MGECSLAYKAEGLIAGHVGLRVEQMQIHAVEPALIIHDQVVDLG
jgi:hypothetical protein